MLDVSLTPWKFKVAEVFGSPSIARAVLTKSWPKNINLSLTMKNQPF